MTSPACPTAVAPPFPAVRTARRSAAAAALRIRPGTIAEYDALARFHYRAARPATIARILALETAGGPVGILVVSMPTLNGRWRDLAWPGRYRTRDRRADAARLNREVQAISRVIIDPRYRGRGLAAQLVRAYLQNPDTHATEAAAAMGACSPFFARAGMTTYTLPPSRRDQHLAAALKRAGITPLSLLRAACREGARLESQPSCLLRPLRTWANAAGSTRRLLSAPPELLARAAAMALLSPTTAFAHGHADLAPLPQAPLDLTRGPHARFQAAHRDPDRSPR